ncbi:MAG TPA: hypothetical protein VL282_06445, partial [Tepidisphaeraceae bacterium]|nr:hypothetical protein [Tepidisphaeraceae bacterium]
KSTRGEQTGSWIAFCVIGMIATLLAPVLLWVMILTFIALLLMRSIPAATRVQFAAVMLAAAVMIIVPWTARNYAVHHEFVPITSNFWANFWKGNNAFATGTDRLPITDQQRLMLESGMTETQRRDARFDSSRQSNKLSPQQRERLNNQPEIVRQLIFKKWAIDWVAANPLDYARLCVIRLGKTLWADIDNPKSQDIYTISRALLLALTVTGATIAIRMRKLRLFPTMLFVVPVIYFSLTLTGARLAIPFEPLQLTAGAYAIGYFAFSRRARAARAVSPTMQPVDLEETQPHHA